MVEQIVRLFREQVSNSGSQIFWGSSPQGIRSTNARPPTDKFLPLSPINCMWSADSFGSSSVSHGTPNFLRADHEVIGFSSKGVALSFRPLALGDLSNINRISVCANNMSVSRSTVIFHSLGILTPLVSLKLMKAPSLYSPTKTMSKKASPQGPSYSPPTMGILSYLPAAWIPYAELIRIHRPLPILMFYFPFLWGSLIAGIMAEPITPPSKMAFVNFLLLLNATLVRGLGCSWNDILDSDVDVKVARTRLRPVARGAISHRQALIYTGLQLMLEFAFIQMLPRTFTYYSIAWLALVAIYPLAKRVTVYTQIALGFAAAWGVLMGFPALDLDLITSPQRMIAAGCLAASYIIWTIGSDLIYAHQDIQDDRKSGINSMAVHHEEKSKAILAGLGVTQVLLLAAMGLMMQASDVYFLGSCGCTLTALWATFGTVNLRDPQDCSKSFNRGAWLANGAVTTGILAEYMIRAQLF